MKRKALVLLTCICLGATILRAQDENEEDEKKGFKENLFTGGSISLAFSSNSFLVGGSPVFGYSIANWADAGIVVNYNYTSYRDIQILNDKLRQSVYGGGGFIRLYPVRFLFAQAQFEHNYIRQKYMPPSGSGPSTTNTEKANSFLVGGGYTTGRYPDDKRPFFYLAVLFDVLRDDFSPYTDNNNRTIPILRAGVQVPLFQGGRR